ncbi:DUF732 domain-containing protein [Mycobacterium spongiae]|uniref:DUF732 domain-containing protein n=1 Tax=Mycobacterium spongiae TaxID=886343 RepID=A0A975PWU0_9MYCO|nr:DUF732 domain-containing protein [Mycobacterium spongiae]QUR67109.1 DUF732 domain-containing protein [Mycobacterium spongiae]
MRLLLTLASVAAMIGMAAPAYADSTDDAFLAALGQAGITYPDPGRAIGAAKWVCARINEGQQTVDVVDTVQRLNSGLSADHAAQFTAIAAKAYCPGVLAQPGGGSDR